MLLLKALSLAQAQHMLQIFNLFYVLLMSAQHRAHKLLKLKKRHQSCAHIAHSTVQCTIKICFLMLSVR